MKIQTNAMQLDTLVSKGEMICAANQFFAEDIQTRDFGNIVTTGKRQTIEKITGFVEAIANVNRIQYHQTLIDGSTTNSEFTLDFTLKDGSTILWHEIIQRKWNDEGLVIHEQYFKT